uniref:hypothetical protein n=1 Tax=uncultured Sphingomonas sp. TaxID=158754 RepID=UPI0035CA8DB3
MRALWVIGLLVLAGCSDPAQDAEDQFRFVQKNGSDDEKCAAARKVYDVYLAQRNEEKLKEARLTKGIYCQLADSNRQIERER